MANKMKEYQKYSEIYERRWNSAMSSHNASEAYAASQDYKKNIEAQEEELKKMDPNSRDYEKAERVIDEQKSKAWDMNYQQRHQFSGEQKKQAYEQLDAKNEGISRDMSKAAERGDVKTYDSLRAQYEKNIASQEQLGGQMKEEGVEFRDTVHQEKVDLQSHDIDMRNKMNAKVAEREAKGKSVNEEDRAAAEKYTKQVKQDEIDLVKYQGDKKVEGMRDRGASEEEIQAQEEENKRDQQWVQSINR